MKKLIVYVFIFALVVSSCGTRAAQGAYTGSQIGSVLGSAIGGISNGWRGRDIGTVVGLVGGAVVGGAIGNACDNAAKKKQTRAYDEYEDDYDDDDEDDDYYENDGTYQRRHTERRNYTGSLTRYSQKAELCNIMFYDGDDNGILQGDENAEIEFEIRNTSGGTIYDVKPVIEEISGMKHINISPSMIIESIGEGKRMRYTAYIKTGRKIKDGRATFRISVYDENNTLIAPRTEFEVETRR